MQFTQWQAIEVSIVMIELSTLSGAVTVSVRRSMSGDQSKHSSDDLVVEHNSSESQAIRLH